MAADNYTDYHQFSWIKISSRITTKTFLRMRILPYTFTLGILGSYIWIFTQNQKIVFANELFQGLFSVSVCGLLLIGIIDFQITKNLPKKIRSYKIDKNGIHINARLYAHEKVQTVTSSKDVGEAGKMWIAIPKKPFGTLKLEYNQPLEKGKILKALEYYQGNH